MNGDLTTTSAVSDAELDASRREVARLSGLLADRELELADLRVALSRFEGLYYSRVGKKYVELDELLARIAEREARAVPDDEAFTARAEQAREQAGRSAKEYRRFASSPPRHDEKVSVSEEIKRLYRRIAALIHPDKAGDDGSRDLRTRLMAELNEAYARGDVRGMEDVSARWESSPETVIGDGPEAERERLKRIAARLRDRIDELREELSRMSGTQLHVLMVKVREGEAGGRDLLGELANEIDLRIRLARRALAEAEG